MKAPTDLEGPTIRRAAAADVEQICDLLFLLKRMYGSCAELDEQEFRRHYAAAVKAALSSPQNAIWVAEESSGALVGFLSTTRRVVLRLAGDVGVLEEVYVQSNYRRRGLGVRLWRAAVAELREQGVKTVEVVTSLAHPGQRQFAKKIGLEWYATIHRVGI